MLQRQLSRFQAAEVTGHAVVRPGARDRAVVEVHWSTPGSSKLAGSNLVVTMTDGRITAMKDYRRARVARRVARAAG